MSRRAHGAATGEPDPGIRTTLLAEPSAHDKFLTDNPFFLR
ncbi:hypothetical protein ACFWFI_18125 [Streptomyces sp. NPDC060209]